MLVNSFNMLLNAKKDKKAIFQFNINNLEWMKHILKTCDKLNEPVILGVSENAVNYMGGYNVVYSLCASLIKDLNISIDVCLHLDHASSVLSCKKAIDAGFTSVMIDMSKESLENNIKYTKEVVKYAILNDVSVEGELGIIGEDINIDINDYLYYYKETNINSLAPSVGTVHGLYNGELNINYNLIKQLNNKLDIPLVLHGGSGLDNNVLKKSVRYGITKININSDLQNVWSQEVRNYLNKNQNIIDPRKIIESGMLKLEEEIIKKFNINK